MFGIMHVHSTFSLHDSTSRPEDIVKKVKDMGYKSVTLTDHGTMFGIDDFMDAGLAYDINTIPGLEAYMSGRHHLILIAKDNEGFRSISHALRDANEHQEKVRRMVFPIMDDEIIERHFKGNTHIIATSACVAGPISSILLENHYNEIKQQKKQAECDKLKPLYDTWKEASDKYKKYAQDVKDLKKEQTGISKYTKKPFLNKIKKDAEKLAKNPDDEKLRESIIQNQLLYDDSVVKVKQLDKRISEATKQRRTWKANVDKLKSKAESYTKIASDIKAYCPIPENVLYEKAKEELMRLKNIFPCFYIELQYHGIDTEKLAMPKLVQLAKETNTPLIAANDAHMLDNSKESIRARQIVRWNYFEMHQDVSEADYTLYLKNESELYETLSEIVGQDVAKEAVENTDILNSCCVKFEKEKHYPKCKTEKSFFELVAEGRQRMINEGRWDDEHESSYQRELKIIPQMGYVDYHMVVYDYCNMMRKLGCIPKRELKNIPKDFSKIDVWLKEKNFHVGVGVGPGRGSAAGSLLCYLLGITNIDPIKYGLLFDRYLNPERVSLPDIDTDVKTSLRPYIIQYLKWKYGERAVCSIMTKTTYAAKGAVQMVGRDRASEIYRGLPKAEYDLKCREYLHAHTTPLSNMIPEKVNIKLKDCDPIFESQFGNDPEKSTLWERAKLIEGSLSSTGVHAGGVVISDNDNINDYVPLSWRGDKEVWAAQCDMIKIEEKGMLKMDLLGLNTLDVESDCLQLIEKHRGIRVNLDTIPHDVNVFHEIYGKGRTNSVFQVESDGMKSMLTRFCPNTLEDIIILVAMFRPGPLQYIDKVIDVKNGRMPLTYLTPELEPILSKTYGSIIYQEQVMQIFQSLAGYSFGQADLVRRAMSKKKDEKLRVERSAFVYGDESRNITGCVHNGISEDIANQLFDEMKEFAKYAFNKSHAAAYSVVSYQTAYLKYYYTPEFLCSMFNNKDTDDYGPIYEDCVTFGIKLLPPSINYSYYEFTIEDGAIRFGLNGIKGITENENNVVKKRSTDLHEMPYTSFCDFLIRNTNQETCSLPNRKIVENLINAGVFDELDYDRKGLLHFFNDVSNWKEKNFNTFCQRIHDKAKEYTFGEQDDVYNRTKEIELMGNIISENPLDAYQQDDYYGCTPYSELSDGKASVLGLVVEIEDKVSKNGREMLAIKLQGRSGKLNVFFLNSKKEQYRLSKSRYINQVVKITGSCKGTTIFGDSMNFVRPKRETLYLCCDTPEKMNSITEVMKNRDMGECYLELTIMFYYKSNGERMCTPGIRTFLVDDQTIQELKAKNLMQIR